MSIKRFKKTVVIHQGALGDLVCTLPGISALRRRSEQMLGVGSSRLKLLEYAGLLDKAVSGEVLGFHRLFMDEFAPGPYLRSFFQDADLAVSWTGKGSAAYKKNLGSLAARAFVFEQSFPKSPGAAHICRVLASPVLESGVEIENFVPGLQLPAESDGDRALPVSGAPFIAVHPGSGGLKKTIPPGKLFRVLGRLRKIFPDEKFVVVAGDADKSLLIELVKQMPVDLRPWVQIVENADLVTLARVLKKARLFLGTDSGPGHLAAALGAKTLSLFGPSDPKVWAPPQAWSRFIAAQCPCAPCPDEKRINCEEAKCLAGIDEREIIEIVQELRKTD
jgi:heptosyltransferase-2